ncbi:MAG: hypothetical protein II404_09435 [Prevotella sp.]|nr:hypothetical protein [Prevotella sp.]
MAVNSIQYPIDFVKNNNQTSTGYGKYYAKAHNAETLTNEGLVDHIVHHNCAVGREAIAAVLKKLGECIPELVAQGQPIKIDGLGIFYGTAENQKNGLTKAQLLDTKVNPLDVLAGIHLRFTPQSDSLNDLTSKSYLKMQVAPVVNLIMDPQGIDLTPTETDPKKKKYATAKATLQEFRAAQGFPENTPNP